MTDRTSDKTSAPTSPKRARARAAAQVRELGELIDGSRAPRKSAGFRVDFGNACRLAIDSWSGHVRWRVLDLEGRPVVASDMPQSTFTAQWPLAGVAGRLDGDSAAERLVSLLELMARTSLQQGLTVALTKDADAPVSEPADITAAIAREVGRLMAERDAVTTRASVLIDETILDIITPHLERSDGRTSLPGLSCEVLPAPTTGPLVPSGVQVTFSVGDLLDDLDITKSQTIPVLW